MAETDVSYVEKSYEYLYDIKSGNVILKRKGGTMEIVLFCNSCKKDTVHVWTNTFSVRHKKVELWLCKSTGHGQAIEK